MEPTTDRTAIGEVPDELTLASASLEQECELLKSAIAVEGGDAAACDAYAPGGLQNPELGARAWYRYLLQLNRAHARVTSGGPAAGSGRRAPGVPGLEEALAASLAEEPVAVQFSDGVVRMVHPKSYHALAWLDSLDRQMRANADAAVACAALEGAEDLRAHALAPLATSLAVRLWLWVLTSRGPGLPFEETATQVDPPKWTRLVTPEDLVRVFEAHAEIHQARLGIISRAFPSETKAGQSRLPLAGFIGVIASENGQDARLLMRIHSLGKIFATSVSAAEGAREARKRAESSAGK